MTGRRATSPWLVSAPWDLAVFGGPALGSLLLLGIGFRHGYLDGVTPVWTWVLTVVAIDVAHVWATGYRVYLDPRELERRPGLYLATPLAAYVLGVLLYSISSASFWRILAYVAVWHFIRQQWGWVKLYRRRAGHTSSIDDRLDDLAIYSATLYPVLYWHAHLPREFAWFLEGDFLPGLPPWIADALAPLHAAIAVAWLLRQAQLLASGRSPGWGKCVVISSTWLAWYAGIVVFDSDYAFTVTNVLIHGVPYLALVWRYGRARYSEEPKSALGRLFRPSLWPVYLAPLVVLALSEEWAWDRLVWHEHGALFLGPALELTPSALALVVPLLALPQATHYVLDAFVWKVRDNEPLSRMLQE